MEHQSKRISPYYLPLRRYSEAFKRSVVRQIEEGRFSKESARRHYRIPGHSTVLRWCAQYSQAILTGVTLEIRMPDERPEQIRREQAQRIKDLERALANATLKIEALETLIEIAKDE